MNGIARKIFNIFIPQSTPRVITFTGGMGAQIFSAAVYHALRETGENVLADLSYFDKTPHTASPGMPGDCSHWSWQLDDFGISQQSFETVVLAEKSKHHHIQDGEVKFQLGIDALRKTSIQSRFPIQTRVADLLPLEFPSTYLCLHIRRGDYLNVASHLVGDEQFISIAKKFSGMLDGLVVLSDSPIPTEFRTSVMPLFTHIAWLDQLDAFSAHRLMRQARALVCSNSQFSLTAGLLNTQGLVLLPKTWFGSGHEAMENVVMGCCEFQTLGHF